MATRPLLIFDETLRDGEQQAGLFLSHEAKRTLAGLIAETGVHRMGVMPAVDDAEAGFVDELVGRRLGPDVTPATRMTKREIDLSRACGVDRVILFYAVSDRLLFLRDAFVRARPDLAALRFDDGLPAELLDRIRSNFLARAREFIGYARSIGLEVDFAAEDASRADTTFLGECIRELAPELDHFMLCDTVGTLTPEWTSEWIQILRDACPDARLAAHFHNDLGLAVENTIRAVLAGATMVSGTFAGIGERAGNVCLDEMLFTLRDDHAIEIEGIDYDAVTAVRRWLDAQGIGPATPGSAEARRHESGIHVQSILLDRKSYCTPEETEPQIWFGRTSGAGNFQYLCERILGEPRSKEEYRRLAAALKTRALRERRCWSAEETRGLLERGELDQAPIRSR